MGFELTDGTGKGFTAKVDATNRLHVDSIDRDTYANASSFGYAYTVNSGYITLTASSSTSGILFLKNDGDNDLSVVRFNLNCKSSSGTTETHGRFVFYRNPISMTSGSGNSVTPRNLNFGSSNTLDVTTEIGQNGASFTSTSEVFGSPVVRLQDQLFVDSVVIIPKGSSFGISFVTPLGNTSIQVAVGLNVYVIEED